MQPEMVLSCKNVHHWFGRGSRRRNVLYDISLDITRGASVGIVGPSGCGKSTLLRAIVGTHPPRSGRIVIYSAEQPEGMIVTSPSRERGIVYQRYSLFPFCTALENVALGLMLDQTTWVYRFFGVLGLNRWRRIRRDHLEQAEEVLTKVGLKEAMHQYPSELSGGMCQRVAIAQALIMKPDLLLLDEPFGALDETTREGLQRMLLTLYAENCQRLEKGVQAPYTFLLVTHEITEAIFVCDRIIGFSPYWNWRENGHTEFPGATVVYDRPAPVFAPDADKRYEEFAQQREEIKRVVFDPKVSQEHDQFVTFWEDLKKGAGGSGLTHDSTKLRFS